MTIENKYTCSFCGIELNTRWKSNTCNWVHIAHKPPEWKGRGDRAEQLELCNDCYKYFLSFIRRNTSDICRLCKYTLCCDESIDSNCEYIEEKPKKYSLFKKIILKIIRSL